MTRTTDGHQSCILLYRVRDKKALVIGICVLLTMAFILVKINREPLTSVVVHNNGAQALRNVAVIYTGGASYQQEIKPHQTFVYKLTPNGESHLVIAFYKNNNARSSKSSEFTITM